MQGPCITCNKITNTSVSLGENIICKYCNNNTKKFHTHYLCGDCKNNNNERKKNYSILYEVEELEKALKRKNKSKKKS